MYVGIVLTKAIKNGVLNTLHCTVYNHRAYLFHIGSANRNGITQTDKERQINPSIHVLKMLITHGRLYKVRQIIIVDT